MEKQTQTARQLPNKFVYGVFVVAAIIFICVRDYSSFMIFGGISLAFDPFDQSQAFNKRPMWQRVWLVVHVLVVMAVMLTSFINYISK